MRSLPPEISSSVGVQRLVPYPVHAHLGKCMVERGQVRAFGVGQGAVDIKNQGLKGGCGHGKFNSTKGK
jgi:hypothetical protein